mmetsp:Transcript_68393/g.189423  ORF Transcript_68393/g.189423 Transcript_68393/m.189423 type:complete len:261 (-) Transcript_68393:50-832(-)
MSCAPALAATATANGSRGACKCSTGRAAVKVGLGRRSHEVIFVVHGCGRVLGRLEPHVVRVNKTAAGAPTRARRLALEEGLVGARLGFFAVRLLLCLLLGLVLLGRGAPLGPLALVPLGLERGKVLVEALDLGLDQALDDLLVLLDREVQRVLLVVEADLAHRHALGLLEVGPGRVHDLHTLLLASFDAVGLDQLRAVLLGLLGHVRPLLALLQSEVHVRRRHVLHVEPDVLRPPIGDQVLVLILVLSHVERVAAACSEV